MRSAGNLKVWQSSKSSPGDFRHRSRGRFFINGFALRAALGIPSPDSRIFGGESKYPPAQSICKLRNKCRSCIRKLLARSGFYLLRAQRNRWTSRTSRGFSPLPTAGQTLSWKSRFSAACRQLPAAFRPFRWKSESSAGNSKESLEIRRSPGTFLRVREVSDLQLNFWIFSEKTENPAEVLIFRPTTSFSAGDLDFRRNTAIFQRDFFFFRRTA